MKILFDLCATQPVGTSEFHGGGEYAKAVFHRLLQLRSDEEIGAFYDPSRKLDASIAGLCQKHSTELHPVRNSKELVALILSRRFDRVYTALPYGYYDVDFDGVELIYTIHGLRPLEMPTDRYESKYGKELVTLLKRIFKAAFPQWYKKIKMRQFGDLLQINAKRTSIVVPSLHTKHALISHFPEVGPNNIVVLYSPRKQCHDEIMAEFQRDVLKKFSVEARSFFLILNANRWIKNAYRAVKALDAIYTQWPQLEKRTLVLGAPKSNEPAWRLKNRDKFVWVGYVPDQELEALYRTAYLLLYPTLNEGFGYPPLEAMRHGTPVIASAIASTTEICGDAVLYLNPYCMNEIKNRVLMLLFEPGLWEDYSRRGQQRAEYIGHRQDAALDELCGLILR